MFEALFDKFKTIAEYQEIYNETIFDICGFPHYENVVSNVLAFFLNDQNQHDLKELVLKSLLESAGIDFEEIGFEFQVDREVVTSARGFIDLFLINENATIVIENKIYSGLNNDLEDYIKHAKSFRKKHSYGILLTLYKTDPQHKDFINVTYSRFISEIRNNLGNFLSSSPNKYLFILIDLINNIEHLNKGTISMNSDFVNFIRENHEEVERFGAELKAFHDNLRKVVKDVNSIVNDQITDIKLKQWAWRELPSLYDVAVSDFQLNNGVGIAIDSVIDASHWSFEISVRNNPGIDFSIKDFCVKLGLNGNLENNRFKLADTLPTDTKVNDVAKKIISIIDIIRATRNISTALDGDSAALHPRQ